MDREQTAAVADKADGMLSGRQPDADAQRHGPTQPAATGREVDITKAKANGHILDDRVFGRALGDDMCRTIETPQHSEDQSVGGSFAGR